MNLNKTVAYLALVLIFSACTDNHEIKPDPLPNDIPSLEKHLKDGLTGDTRLQAYYMLYGRYLYKDNDKAEWYIDELLKLAKEENSQPYIARAKHGKGYVKQIKGDYLGALPWLLQAVDLFDELDDVARMADDINNIGLIFLKVEGYKDAIPYFEKAAIAYKRTEDLKYQSVAVTNLAICNSKTQQYTEAKENIRLAVALQLQFDSNDVNRLAHVYNEAGNIFYNASQYNQAIEHYNKALAFNPNYEQMQVILYDNLANTYLTKGNYDKATKFLSKGRGISIDNKTAVERYNIEGTLYQQQDKHLKAIEIFEQAINMADKEIINEPLNNTLELLSKSYRIMTDNGAKVAYEDIYRIADLKEQQQELKDSFYNGMNAKALQAALSKEVEAHNNRKLQASMEAQQWVMFRYAIAILVGLLMLLWVMTKQKRRWALSSHEWEAKSNEWEASTHELEDTYQEIASENQELRSMHEKIKERHELFLEVSKRILEEPVPEEYLKRIEEKERIDKRELD
ncbi:tetratricopeptide repeat protein [Fulvivirga kasyanovii]|uniref:tetratricopeptide repeat protein n=1 Tax=Fulvivirga kasyanovii TaxID=396812 RepID=UPI001625282B|nr:tetratricopeptide repeat protein [Fulvivirga kasyanovii]